MVNPKELQIELKEVKVKLKGAAFLSYEWQILDSRETTILELLGGNR